MTLHLYVLVIWGQKHAHYYVVNDWVCKWNQQIFCIFNKIWLKKDLRECNIIQYKLFIEQSHDIYAIESFLFRFEYYITNSFFFFFDIYLDCNPDIWLKTNIEYQVFVNKIKNSVIYFIPFYFAKSDFILQNKSCWKCLHQSLRNLLIFPEEFQFKMFPPSHTHKHKFSLFIRLHRWAFVEYIYYSWSNPITFF